MNTEPGCPTADRWRGYIQDDLPADDHAALTAHLDGCTACQRVLDTLTALPDALADAVCPLWAEAPTLLSLPPSTRPATGAADPAGPPGAPPADDTPLAFLAPPGRPDSLGRLGNYEALEVLGRGGFGIVLRAFDTVLQRVVAIKVLAPELAATSPARKRFLREAWAAAQVRHESVVQIHAVEEQPLPYLVMEVVPGETLQQRLDRIGPLEVTEVVAIGRQVADGLAAAHAAGLVHRDVKPANILLESGPRLRVKITDFGLARAADDASITQSGVVAGTPLYMSPEQAAGGKIDPRSDLFSLGSVLYTITAGRPPFRAGTALAVLKRVTEDTPRPIPEIIPETPAWLSRFIARLMEKDPDRRFQTAAEVSAALEAAESAAPRLAGAGRRLGLVGGGLALAAAVALGVYSLTRPHPGPAALDPAPAAPGTAVADPRPRIGGGGFRFDRVGVKCRPQVSRDGRLVAAPCGPGVTLFDVASGEALRTLDSPSGEVRGVAFSPTGRRLALFSHSPGKVQVWDLADDRVLFTADADDSIHFEPVFSPDGTRLVVAEQQPVPRLRVLDALTGAEVKSVPTTTWFAGRFNPTVSRFAATHRNPKGVSAPHPDQDKVTVWDTADWREVGTLTHPPPRKADDAGTGCVQYSPGGKYLAASGDSGVAVWKADTLEPVGTVKADCFWFDFLPDGETLLVDGTDDFEQVHRFVRYDIASGQNRGEFTVRGPKDFLYVSLDPAREYLFVAPYTTGTRLRIFEPLTGRELLPGGQIVTPTGQ